MKYTLLNLVLYNCSSLQSRPFPSICKGFSLSAPVGGTVGTDFLESRVERSRIDPKFQGHPENGAFGTVSSFSETRRNRKWQDQASEGLGTLAMVLVAQTCCTGKSLCSDALSW